MGMVLALTRKRPARASRHEPGKLIVLGAGGTGGHLFPAEALAEALLARGRRLMLVTDSATRSYGGALGKLEAHPLGLRRMGDSRLSRLLGLASVAARCRGRGASSIGSRRPSWSASAVIRRCRRCSRPRAPESPP
jgi:hypothetical protein